MTNQKQIEANRKNAFLATGPKSNEGKIIVGQNARKHGILSKKVFVGEEQKQDFDKLAKSFYEEMQPYGSLESFLVEKIIVSSWRLSLIVRAESEFFEQGSCSYEKHRINEAFEGYSSGYMRVLSRYEKSLENSFYRALNELKILQYQRRSSENKEIVIDSFQ